MALAASIWPVLHAARHYGEAVMSDFAFLGMWLGILCVSSMLNVFLLGRESAQTGEPVVSARMRMALRAFAPPMVVGGCVGIGLIVLLHNLTLAALIWIMCYGLALLATASFSPVSLIRLGWAFVAAGILAFFGWAANPDILSMASDLGPASIAMGLTFGLLHVVYALAVFCSRQPRKEQAA